MAKQYTQEEFIDFVQQDLSIGYALPIELPCTEIQRFIETQALDWFYQNYFYSVIKMYYFLDKEAFKTDEFTRFRYITLPDEIQTIPYIYQIMGTSLFQLGINVPNLSVNMGVSNQPYLSSYTSTIAELGVYKSIIDSMSDMLNQMNKYTVRYDFNYPMHRLHILSDVRYDLILECYANAPKEFLFTDPQFQKYVIGWSRQQLGRLLGRYDWNLPGGVKINSDALVNEGKEGMKEVEEYIKGQSQTGFFYMVKR